MNLSDYLAIEDMSQTEFAKEIGVSVAAVSRYCGDRVPAPEIMMRIRKKTDGAVQPNDYFDPFEAVAT